MEELIAGFGTAPSDEAENVLFQLAEVDPNLYANHAWRDAAIGRGTLSAGRRVVDLAANGALEGKGTDRGHMAHQLAGLIGEHPELRTHVYQLIKDGATPGLALLAQAVAENPDTDGLLLLIKIEIEHKRSFISWHTIENVVTEPSLPRTGKAHTTSFPFPPANCGGSCSL